MISVPTGWSYEPLTKFIDARSGNGKLIKGKQSSESIEGFVPAFSASGQDIWTEKADFFGDGIVVSAVGARCGKAFLAGGSWTAVANTHVLQIKQGAELDIKYLWYLCNDENWWIRSGTAQPFVKVKDTLERLQLVPPIDEQRKIVELLEDHLSRLDAALDDVRQAKILASQFRASVLNYVFFDSGTKGWTPYKAADLGKWITGSTPSSKVQDFIGEDVPFITPGDILDGGEIINYSRMISNLGADAVRRLRSNSVHLVCIGATLGKVGIVRFETTSNQQINALEANEEIVLPDFVMWLLATPSMQRKLWEASSSTTVPILNKGNLEKIELRVPDLNGQRKALEEFDRARLTYEHLKKDFESILDKSNRLRRSILQAAFTGQLTKEVESV
jgi:restriction endonuclease S subunit